MNKSKKSKITSFKIYILQHENEDRDFVRIAFNRDMGRKPSYICEPRSLLNKPAVLYDRLCDAGADLKFPQTEIKTFIKNIMDNHEEELGLYCTTTGWKKFDTRIVYLLGKKLITASNKNLPVFLSDDLKPSEPATSGTLPEWKNEVASLASNSIAASTAIMTSLAGPLLKFSKLMETFVINFAGNGSTGKSTSLRVAASIWRDPAVLPSWNTTEQGLNEELALHNDNCIILDDTQQGAAAGRDKLSEFMTVTHRATHGTTRQRSKTVANSLPAYTTKCLLLSSSPELVSITKSKHGRDTDDGDRARFLEMQIHHGDNGGIWAETDVKKLNADNGRELSDRLSNAAKSNFGCAGQAWIKYLIQHQSLIEDTIVKLTDKFLSQLKLDKNDSVKARIAQKIALLYAAGRIAIKANILPWKKAQVLKVANAAYDNIIANAFPKPNHITDLWSIFFASLSDTTKFITHNAPTLKGVNFDENMYGIIQENNNKILIKAESLKAIYRKGGQENDMGYHQLIKQLIKIKAIKKGHTKTLTQSIRVGYDNKKIRFLVLDKTKIDEEHFLFSK